MSVCRVLFVALLVSACSSGATAGSGPAMARSSSHGTCSLTDGATAAVGSSVPSDDGCNTCTCGPSGWACTERACR